MQMQHDRNSKSQQSSTDKCPIAKKYPLTHCILVDSPTVTCLCWTSPFVILGVSDLLCHFYSVFGGKSCLQTV